MLREGFALPLVPKMNVAAQYTPREILPRLRRALPGFPADKVY